MRAEFLVTTVVEKKLQTLASIDPMVVRAFGTDEETALQFLLPDETATIGTLIKQSLSTNPSLLLAGSLKCRFVSLKPSHDFMIVETGIPEQPPTRPDQGPHDSL